MPPLEQILSIKSRPPFQKGTDLQESKLEVIEVVSFVTYANNP